MGNSPACTRVLWPSESLKRIHTKPYGNTHLRIQVIVYQQFLILLQNFFLVNEANMKLDEKVKNLVLQELGHSNFNASCSQLGSFSDPISSEKPEHSLHLHILST